MKHEHKATANAPPVAASIAPQTAPATTVVAAPPPTGALLAHSMNPAKPVLDALSPDPKISHFAKKIAPPYPNP